MTTMTIDLDGLVLKSGAHDKASPDCCVMEAVAVLACAVAAPKPVPTWAEALRLFGPKCKTDRPKDACRVISAFMRRLNDRITDVERQRLKPYALKLVGTRAPRGVEVHRAYIMADVAVRVFAPMALDARGLPEQAAALRACDPITNQETARNGRDAYDAYADAAAAAYAYAYAAYDAAAAADAVDADAAYDAYADAAAAAYAYAYAAYDAAAAYAAYAAYDAVAAADAYAAYAAYDAVAAADAYAAARSRLIDEALAAVDRMLAVTEL